MYRKMPLMLDHFFAPLDKYLKKITNQRDPKHS